MAGVDHQVRAAGVERHLVVPAVMPSVMMAVTVVPAIVMAVTVDQDDVGRRA